MPKNAIIPRIAMHSALKNAIIPRNFVHDALKDAIVPRNFVHSWLFDWSVKGAGPPFFIYTCVGWWNSAFFRGPHLRLYILSSLRHGSVAPSGMKLLLLNQSS